MSKSHLTIALAIATSTLIAPTLAARADDMSHMNMSAMTGSPADKAYESAMQTMMKDMAVKPTGDADKDFVLMMLPHHQGAVDMANVEIKYGKDPMLVKLATDIVAAQEKEIAEMKDWLAKHGN